MNGMQEVTKEHFHSTVGRMNVHPNPKPGPKGYGNAGSYSEWKTPMGRIMGYTVEGKYDYKNMDPRTRYYTNMKWDG